MLDRLHTIDRLYNYNPDTGLITRKIPQPGKNGQIGDRAGSIGANGYVQISVGDKSQRVYGHHVAWYLHYREWPENVIDHINGNRSDNRISNLRHVTRSENMRNLRLPRNNKTGIQGVYWCKRRLKYYISIGGKHVTQHRDFFEACCIRKAEEKIRKYHVNHGK